MRKGRDVESGKSPSPRLRGAHRYTTARRWYRAPCRELGCLGTAKRGSAASPSVAALPAPLRISFRFVPQI